MKPAPFEYHRPESTGDVTALLAEFGDEAKPLAGGQSLVPMLSMRLARYGHLVDLNRVSELRGVDRSDDRIRIGAMVTQAAAEHDDRVAASAPLLHRALPHIGHLQIRNRGTIGGSIAHADPASELPAVVLALDATLEASGPRGLRRIAAADFFESMWTTALADDEILSTVEIPVWPGRCRFGFVEIARRHGDFALVGAAVGVAVDGDAVSRAAIALFGVASTPVRATEAEDALIAGGTATDLTEIGRVAAARLSPFDDVHASGAYRKAVAEVVVQRALADALEEARS